MRLRLMRLAGNLNLHMRRKSFTNVLLGPFALGIVVSIIVPPWQLYCALPVGYDLRKAYSDKICFQSFLPETLRGWSLISRPVPLDENDPWLMKEQRGGYYELGYTYSIDISWKVLFVEWFLLGALLYAASIILDMWNWGQDRVRKFRSSRKS